MSLFVVRDSHRSDDTFDFCVVYREGGLASGDTFTLFDTHHPLVFTVRDARELNRAVTLLRTTCVGGMPYDSFAAHATVDTDDPEYARTHDSLPRAFPR